MVFTPPHTHTEEPSHRYSHLPPHTLRSRPCAAVTLYERLALGCHSVRGVLHLHNCLSEGTAQAINQSDDYSIGRAECRVISATFGHGSLPFQSCVPVIDCSVRCAIWTRLVKQLQHNSHASFHCLLLHQQVCVHVCCPQMHTALLYMLLPPHYVLYKLIFSYNCAILCHAMLPSHCSVLVLAEARGHWQQVTWFLGYKRIWLVSWSAGMTNT